MAQSYHLLLPPRGIWSSRSCECPRRRVAWGEGLVLDGVGGVVGAGARVRYLSDRAGVGATQPDRGADERLWGAVDQLGDRAGRRVLIMLLRRHRDRQVALSEGRVGGQRAGIPVRFDQPGMGART